MQPKLRGEFPRYPPQPGTCKLDTLSVDIILQVYTLVKCLWIAFAAHLRKKSTLAMEITIKMYILSLIFLISSAQGNE